MAKPFRVGPAADAQTNPAGVGTLGDDAESVSGFPIPPPETTHGEEPPAPTKHTPFKQLK